MKNRNQFSKLFFIVALVEVAAAVMYFCRGKMNLGLLYFTCAVTFFVLGMRREDEDEGNRVEPKQIEEEKEN